MLVDHNKTCVLVNSFEFHIDLINHEPSMNTFADLITLGSQNEISFPEPHNSGHSQPPPVFSDLPSGKVGRPAKHIQFAGIVEVALAFIQQHGYSAQCRRRSDTANSCGLTLAQIRKHLLENIPVLNEAGISRQTIHNIMVAPRAKTINSKARVPKKDNSGTFNEHPDRHFCASQVKGAVEFGVKFQYETLLVSSANMNKVNVGVLAVSRYHQLQHFFPGNDLPVYPDHDFPSMNSKITPSGYLVLKLRNSQELRHRARSLSPPKRLPESAPMSCRRSQSRGDTPAQQAVGVRDKHDRLHYEFPRTGPFHVYCRANMFHTMTAQTHVNDLNDILTNSKDNDDKSGVIIIGDNGPDYAPKSNKVFLNCGLLFKAHHLDYLILVSYAPGDSARNPIEHGWAPLSRFLSGVILPRSLPGKHPPEERKSRDGLTAEQVSLEESQMFDNAFEMLCSYWQDKTYDGYDIYPKAVPCQEPHERLSDSKELDKFFQSSPKQITSDEALKKLQSELKFLCKHSVRTRYMVVFCRCQEGSCPHCSHLPKPSEAVFGIVELSLSSQTLVQ